MNACVAISANGPYKAGVAVVIIACINGHDRIIPVDKPVKDLGHGVGKFCTVVQEGKIAGMPFAKTGNGSGWTLPSTRLQNRLHPKVSSFSKLAILAAGKGGMASVTEKGCRRHGTGSIPPFQKPLRKRRRDEQG